MNGPRWRSGWTVGVRPASAELIRSCTRLNLTFRSASLAATLSAGDL
jgi:hypothetical protein